MLTEASQHRRNGFAGAGIQSQDSGRPAIIGLEAAWTLAPAAACLKVAVFIGLQADSVFSGIRAALALNG